MAAVTLVFCKIKLAQGSRGVATYGGAGSSRHNYRVNAFFPARRGSAVVRAAAATSSDASHHSHFDGLQRGVASLVSLFTHQGEEPQQNQQQQHVQQQMPAVQPADSKSQQQQEQLPVLQHVQHTTVKAAPETSHMMPPQDEHRSAASHAEAAAAAAGAVAAPQASSPQPAQQQPPQHQQAQPAPADRQPARSPSPGPVKATASELLAGVPLEQMLERQRAQRELLRQRQHLSGGNGKEGGQVHSSDAARTSGVTSPEAAMAFAAYNQAIAHRRGVPVLFRLKHPLQPGQRLKVVGGHDSLGKWALQRAPELHRSGTDVWQATVKLPEGSVTEYKYVLLDSSGNVLSLQQGNNGVVAVRTADRRVEVHDTWAGDSGGSGIVAEGDRGMVLRTSREARIMSWANDMFEQVATLRQDLRRARVEVVGAQEEAKEARAEARHYKVQLQAKQARLAELETAYALNKSKLVHAETMNAVLRTKLEETTQALKEAIDTAEELLANQQDVEWEEVEEEEE